MTDYNKKKNLIAYTIVIVAVIMAGFTAVALSGILKDKNDSKRFSVSSTTSSLSSFIKSSHSSSQSLNNNLITSSISSTTSYKNTISSQTATNHSSDGYQNGTYTSNQSYFIKGHTVNVTVKVVLSDGKLVSSTVTGMSGTDHESQEYISYFNQESVKTLPNTDLKEADAFSVSGASLTSNAFTKAIQDIKTQAKL